MCRMLIGLISDTHIPEAGPEIPPQVFKAFENVDLILHAGDMHIIDVLDWLEPLAPVWGAQGNGDHNDGINPNRPGLPPDARVEEVHTLQLEGLRVGLIHGFPLPHELPWRTLEELLDLHFTRPIDIVVCGDTHMARFDWYDDVLIINPGSPTLPGQIKELGTVGFLEINDREVVPSIVNLSDY
ncbi:MAG: metallophosphoesterase family protein [SAR202 cluster bacterium]|nr:YfcE family phosphodiesterase [Chloroflexota bacterium]MDP6421314.1 metallophosphoesterase family protein [SAR202 cluster bacterium]MQG59034.1 metallophosphoesterase family protein [SAR202 cluster bacterium]MQG69677.1 metallophosphoesterase family protein [SAR202 cluster bacterium]HAL49595.1 YfcE family phosphodiesterase [Dehalococcoidia bacterium]